jgi:hypothetical protein
VLAEAALQVGVVSGLVRRAKERHAARRVAVGWLPRAPGRAAAPVGRVFLAGPPVLLAVEGPTGERPEGRASRAGGAPPTQGEQARRRCARGGGAACGGGAGAAEESGPRAA